jgi:hypothetical protein
MMFFWEHYYSFIKKLRLFVLSKNLEMTS